MAGVQAHIRFKPNLVKLSYGCCEVVSTVSTVSTAYTVWGGGGGPPAPALPPSKPTPHLYPPWGLGPNGGRLGEAPTRIFSDKELAWLTGWLEPCLICLSASEGVLCSGVENI